jgi:hypothetical protein
MPFQYFMLAHASVLCDAFSIRYDAVPVLCKAVPVLYDAAQVLYDAAPMLCSAMREIILVSQDDQGSIGGDVLQLPVPSEMCYVCYNGVTWMLEKCFIDVRKVS